MNQALPKPFVFVIMPFDAAWRDYYELGIKPACEAAGAVSARVDEQIFLETILDRIYAQIEQADLVVAEMTDRNPNVFYETGYAHGIAKPVLLLTRTADDIPFDLRQYPHVVHEGSIVTLRERLEERVRWCLDNPELARAALRRHAAAEQNELALMAEHIVNYLNANHFKSMSFARIQAQIDEGYTDDKLLRLIAQSPSRFRRVRLRDDRRGIALVT